MPDWSRCVPSQPLPTGPCQPSWPVPATCCTACHSLHLLQPLPSPAAAGTVTMRWRASPGSVRSPDHAQAQCFAPPRAQPDRGGAARGVLNHCRRLATHDLPPPSHCVRPVCRSAWWLISHGRLTASCPPTPSARRSEGPLRGAPPGSSPSCRTPCATSLSTARRRSLLTSTPTSGTPAIPPAAASSSPPCDPPLHPLTRHAAVPSGTRGCAPALDLCYLAPLLHASPGIHPSCPCRPTFARRAPHIFTTDPSNCAREGVLLGRAML